MWINHVDNLKQLFCKIFAIVSKTFFSIASTNTNKMKRLVLTQSQYEAFIKADFLTHYIDTIDCSNNVYYINFITELTPTEWVLIGISIGQQK
jgi:hypothetical protein